MSLSLKIQLSNLALPGLCTLLIACGSNSGNSGQSSVATSQVSSMATSSLASSSSSATSSSSSIALHPINDTGTSYCRDNTGELNECLVSEPQDGNTGRDVKAELGVLDKQGAGPQGFDWTKVSNSGKIINPQNNDWMLGGNAGQQWACVVDNHTGLTWEVKTDDSASPHYTNLRYSWYNPDAATNGSEAGTQNTDDCNGVTCNTLAYIAYLNSLNYCGHSNWRLPTVNELMTLAVTDNIDLAMDTHYFPNAKNDQYWSSQSYAPVRTRAWYLYFSDGSTGSTIKEAPNYVRLVAAEVNP